MWNYYSGTGMEGALPSVVAGLVMYLLWITYFGWLWVGEGGFTALYAMLQSCAPGIG